MKKGYAISEMLRGAVLAAVFVTVLSFDASAQQPGSSAVDFSGVWRRRIESIAPVGGEVPFQPWSKEVYESVSADMDAGRLFVDNRTLCLPDGGVDVMFPPYLMQLVQTPTRLHLLHEFNSQMRTVYIDAEHPTDPKPSWYGHSVGRWDGDVLTVETIGYNDRTPLMTLFQGLSRRTNVPHTDSLRVVERFSLSDDGSTMTNRMTFDDPGTYTEPWTIEIAYTRLEDERLAEFVCADDPRLLEADNPPDLEGLITVGADGNHPLDLATVAPTQ